jgi:molecular chaperone HtpG
MTADEIKKYINQVAFSGATEFLEKFKEANDANEIIGRFGLGFYSSFMVAEKVEIQTLSYQDGAAPAKWTVMAAPNLRSAKVTAPKEAPMLFYISMQIQKNFLEEHRISEILNKYAKFLPVPVQFGTKTESVPDGEDAEGKPKYKEVEVDNIINNTTPIWTKQPNELKDEDYLSFYRELYPFAEEPLFGYT